MYARAILYASFLIVLLLSNPALAQDPKRSLGRFRSGGGFGFDVPEIPEKAEPVYFVEGGVCARGKWYMWVVGDHFVAGAAYVKLSNCGKSVARPIVEKSLSDFVSGFSKAFQTNETRVDEGPIEVMGLGGGQMMMYSPEKTLILRSFISGERYFLVYAMFHPEKYEDDDGIRMLDTFRLLSRSELNDAKIAEAAPPPLPQARVISKLGTDAAELSLRGKVRSLSEYTLTPSNEKLMRSEIEFDRNRERVRSVDYYDGYPTSVTAWGSIDGARVSLSGFISFDTDQRRPGADEEVMVVAPRQTVVPLAASPSPKPTPKPTPDKRYSARYAYVYGEDGAIAERSTLGNDGTLRSRTVYKRVDSTREIETFDAAGKRYVHRFEILDENGDVIESWFESEAGKKSTTFKYKFDAAGNWIERKAYRKVISEGDTTVTLTETVFRAIAYYE